MSARTIMPFGPQHPVLPEPIHLDLVLEDETVVGAIPTIGFIHRGLEKLVEKKDYKEMVYVAERICGICSFIHGMGYSMVVEQCMDIEIPDRAQFLRVFWAELSRVHSHILWLGLFADAFGFESLFMHCWRLRESVLDIFDMTTGGRVIFSVCKVGGVRKDIDSEKLKRAVDTLEKIEGELRELSNVFLNDTSVIHRTRNLGTLTTAQAYDLGAVGPTARGCGVAADLRETGYSIYPHVDFKMQVEEAGDCYARTKVRIDEIFESIRIVKKCVELMPAGESIETKVTGNPTGESFVMLEQPRGEVVYHVKGNGTKNLDRLRVRTPTFANIAPLVEMLKGVQLADVPILVLTIDPCISCTER